MDFTLGAILSLTVFLLIWAFEYRRFDRGIISYLLNNLGFTKFDFNTLKQGIFLFYSLVAIFFIISISYSLIFNPQIDVTANAIKLLYSSYGLYFIVIIFVSVFVEELVFRAYFVPRIGIVISSLIFAIMHFSYGTWFQIIGPFILGLIISYYWAKHQNFYVVFIGHYLYNIFIIFLALYS